MQYRKSQLTGVPSSQSIFTRYQQVGYLKGVLNFSSKIKIEEEVEKQVKEAIENLNPEDISGMDNYVNGKVETGIKDYVATDEFQNEVAKASSEQETLYIFPDDEHERD